MNLPCRVVSVVVAGLTAASCGGGHRVAIGDAAVQIIAEGCSTVEVHGAGMMTAEGRIATVAHVVAGATRVQVRGTGGSADATVVYFDPVRDLAVLQVDSGVAEPIDIGTAKSGDRGSVIVYRDGEPLVLRADVQRPVDIRTADIYGDGTHIRPGYELNVDIQAGDSGAVVVVDGKAVALLWATSRQAEDRTWAMKASLLTDHLATDTPVDNGECA